MTVNHLRNVQRMQRQKEVLQPHCVTTMATDAPLVTNYRRGFNECAVEIGKYVHRVNGLDQGARARLMNHLAGCAAPSHVAALQSVGAIPLVDATQLSSLPGSPVVVARSCFTAPSQCATLPTESARRTSPPPSCHMAVTTDTRNDSLLNSAIPLYINTASLCARAKEVTSPGFPTPNSPKVGADAPDVSPKYRITSSFSPMRSDHECAHGLMSLDTAHSPVWRPWWKTMTTRRWWKTVPPGGGELMNIATLWYVHIPWQFHARFPWSDVTILHSLLSLYNYIMLCWQ